MNLLSLFYINLTIPSPDILTASSGAQSLAWPGYFPSLVIWASACLQVINKKETKKRRYITLGTILGHHFITLSLKTIIKVSMIIEECYCSGVVRDFAGPYFVSEDNMAFGKPAKYWKLDPARWVVVFFLILQLFAVWFPESYLEKSLSWLNGCAVLNEVFKKLS